MLLSALVSTSADAAMKQPASAQLKEVMARLERLERRLDAMAMQSRRPAVTLEADEGCDFTGIPFCGYEARALCKRLGYERGVPGRVDSGDMTMIKLRSVNCSD